MEAEKLHILIERFLDGNASSEENQMIEKWYQSFELKRGLTEQLSEEELINSLSEGFASILKVIRQDRKTTVE